MQSTEKARPSPQVQRDLETLRALLDQADREFAALVGLRRRLEAAPRGTAPEAWLQDAAQRVANLTLTRAMLAVVRESSKDASGRLPSP